MTAREDVLTRALTAANETGEAPAWWREARERSFRRLEQRGLPPARSEAWKYSAVDTLFEPSSTAIDSAPLVEPAVDSPLYASPAVRIHGSGGSPCVIDTLSAVPAAASIAGAIADPARYPLTDLNLALTEDAVYLRIDGPMTEPLVVTHVSGPCYRRLVIDVAPGAEAHVIEQHAGFSRLTSAVAEIRIAANATLTHTRLLPPAQTREWHLTAVSLAADARYRGCVVAGGAALRRQDFAVYVDDAGADAELNGALMAGHGEHLDVTTNIEHRRGDGRSRQLFRGMATGKGQLTFNGRIHIHRGAQRSDAALDNKNLLLDERARINTKPELEIYADDVRCAHGATVGRMDPDALFYLKSRGIPDHAARALVSEGFLLAAAAGVPVDDAVRRLVGAFLTAEARA